MITLDQLIRNVVGGISLEQQAKLLYVSRLHGFVCTTRDATDTEYASYGLTPATKNRLAICRIWQGVGPCFVRLWHLRVNLDSRLRAA